MRCDAYASFYTPVARCFLNDSYGYSEIDAQAFKFSVCGKPTIESNDIMLYFTNAENNYVWLKIRVYDENDFLLGESGLLKPGEYVEKISLLESDIKKIKYKIMAYEPETYYSEGSVVLNTVISGE